MKMTNLKIALAFVATSATLVACNPTTKNTDGDTQDTTALADAVGAVAVNPLSHAKEFPGATLEIASITAEPVGTGSAKVAVKCNVSNCELAEETEHDHHMTSYHDGQHIHVILDDGPDDA